MRTNFDPPADPFGNEAETPAANGEWFCPKCGRTRRTYRSNGDSSYCAVDGKSMIWKPDDDTTKEFAPCPLCGTLLLVQDLPAPDDEPQDPSTAAEATDAAYGQAQDAGWLIGNNMFTNFPEWTEELSPTA